MKPTAVAVLTLAVLATAGCSLPGLSKPSPSPSALPSGDITIGYADNRGTFFLGLDQTLLVTLPRASVRYPPLLSRTGSYPEATLFTAVALGRTTVMATPEMHCDTCDTALAPIQITVVVVEPAELQHGVTVSDQDWYSVIHVRTGQPFEIALANAASGLAWTTITANNPAVIVADQPPTPSAVGIRGRFHGGQPGRAVVTVTSPVCPTGSACPRSNSTSSSFVVFA